MAGLPTVKALAPAAREKRVATAEARMVGFSIVDLEVLLEMILLTDWELELECQKKIFETRRTQCNVRRRIPSKPKTRSGKTAKF